MFRLAFELGKTVQELEDGMSSSEFNEWIAYLKMIDERSTNND